MNPDECNLECDSDFEIHLNPPRVSRVRDLIFIKGETSSFIVTHIMNSEVTKETEGGLNEACIRVWLSQLINARLTYMRNSFLLFPELGSLVT